VEVPTLGEGEVHGVELTVTTRTELTVEVHQPSKRNFPAEALTFQYGGLALQVRGRTHAVRTCAHRIALLGPPCILRHPLRARCAGCVGRPCWRFSAVWAISVRVCAVRMGTPGSTLILGWTLG
jgi:hypothetical protein